MATNSVPKIKDGVNVEDFIIELLKDNNGNPISGKEIENLLDITNIARNNLMTTLIKKYAQVKNVARPSKTALYVWRELGNNTVPINVITIKPNNAIITETKKTDSTGEGNEVKQVTKTVKDTSKQETKPVEAKTVETKKAEETKPEIKAEQKTEAKVKAPTKAEATEKKDSKPAEAVKTKEPVKKDAKKPDTFVEPASIAINNSEGYVDPTAAKAMSTIKGKPFPGEIWRVQENGIDNKAKQWRVFVINVCDDIAHIIRLFPKKDGTISQAGELPFYISVKYKTNIQEYIGNPSRLYCRNLMYFKERISEVNDAKLKSCRALVAHFLGIEGVQIVERIVYKEKPAEPEVPNKNNLDKIVEEAIPETKQESKQQLPAVPVDQKATIPSAYGSMPDDPYVQSNDTYYPPKPKVFAPILGTSDTYYPPYNNPAPMQEPHVHSEYDKANQQEPVKQENKPEDAPEGFISIKEAEHNIIVTERNIWREVAKKLLDK